MEVKAGAKYLRGSPRKARLVAKVVNGLPPTEAIARLTLLAPRPRLALMKVIKQAIANAKNNAKLNVDDLVIKQVRVAEGPRFKRIDKSHGARFDSGMIRKRFYHLEVILQPKTELVDQKAKSEPVDYQLNKSQGGTNHGQ